MIINKKNWNAIYVYEKSALSEELPTVFHKKSMFLSEIE